MKDMFGDVNEIAIFVTTLLSIAIGSIWYSPLVFGKYWMQSAGISDGDIEEEGKHIVRSVIFACIANFFVFLSLAKFIVFAEQAGVSYITLGGYLGLFCVGLLSYTVIWERRSRVYFAIHTSYAVLLLLVGIVVISYWPW